MKIILTALLLLFTAKYYDLRSTNEQLAEESRRAVELSERQRALIDLYMASLLSCRDTLDEQFFTSRQAAIKKALTIEEYNRRRLSYRVASR